MALTKCPECTLQVSDRALACPHCGYPMDVKPSVKKAYKRPAKRRRLPNGFGSITEVKGKNLRKPYLARLTVGKSPLGTPIKKPFGYFETYEDAYSALIEYHKNPYELDNTLSVSELYEKWIDAYITTTTSESYRQSLKSAWLYCSSIYNMRAKDVRVRHMKGCMEDGYRIGTRGKEKGKIIKASPSTQTRIKSIFNLMFDYALEYEIVTVNYARNFEISEEILQECDNNKRGHIVFSKAEMSALWNNVNTVEHADWIVIQSYMGWRPQEMGLIMIEDVNLDEWIIVGGMKTKAGKRRTVPIHTEIRGLIQKNYDIATSLGSPYLINDISPTRGSHKITYDKYSGRFNKVIEALDLNPDHRPHDPRNTFITMAKKSKFDEYALKLVVGHKIQDITEGTYTTRDIEWIREDIEKISCEVLI